MKQNGVGVENTNNNTYDVTITAEDFYTKVDFDAIPNERVRCIYRDFLERTFNKAYSIEHVDTHSLPDGRWRVQLRLVVSRFELQEKWSEIVDMMEYADPMWESYFLVDAYFKDRGVAFYGKITFIVPSK